MAILRDCFFVLVQKLFYIETVKEEIIAFCNFIGQALVDTCIFDNSYFQIKTTFSRLGTFITISISKNFT
jgi:hypothetical protein